MSRKCVVWFSVIVFFASFIAAQEKDRPTLPIKSVLDAAFDDVSPRHISKHGWGSAHLKTSDGRPHAGKSAGVVVVQSNTDEAGSSLCTEPFEEMVVPTSVGDLVFWRAPLHRLIVGASPKRSEILEIIWSGQINVYSGFTHPMDNQYQTAFLECTVTQRGHTVPCSGTDWIPAIAQDLTENGLSNWVTYHGYVEFNPKKDATVELWIWSWPWEGYQGLLNVCGDTLTLKY